VFIKKTIHSFRFALLGIKKVFISERNFRFHSIATALVTTAGLYFHITKVEWIYMIIAIGFVVVAEAFNSAIEKLVDMVEPQQHPQAGWIKDVAAGAVLLASITAAIIGVLVFLPYIG
jgi:diacylglycerol kinase (ATP)